MSSKRHSENFFPPARLGRVVLSILMPIVLLAGLSACTGGGEEDGLTVYSSRQAHLIEPLFDKYTKETGVPIRFINDEAGALLHRLDAEAESTQADLFLTVDAGNLWQAAEQGYLLPLESEVLGDNLPSHLRDPQNRWFGLSVRARTIVYSTERVEPEALSTYEALAGPEWQNRLCLRTSKKVYNQSLVAMMIVAHGEEKTEEIVKGWVGNLAAAPFANDVAVMEAIRAGQCDVGIVNSYYFGRLQKDEPDIPLALFWPNQDSNGVHVNVAGGGVVKNSDTPGKAQALLEWLSRPEAQSLFAALDLEYPASPDVDAHPLVQSWGDFKPNPVNISKAGALQADAVKLMERAGYR